MTTSLWIGCCGFACARRAYFRRLSLVEVQRTFYQPPATATLARWRAEAPAEFEFTLKAWQVITHPAESPTYRRLREPLAAPEEAGFFRATPTVREAWTRTRAAAAALGACRVLFQCPARFTPSDPNIEAMRSFFAGLDREGLVLLWEPRGAWPDSVVRELCAELELVHVVHPFGRRPATPGAAYFRLHGPRGYRSRYTDGELAELLRICAEHPTAYCLFNNMTMLEDARRLQALAARAAAAARR